MIVYALHPPPSTAGHGASMTNDKLTMASEIPLSAPLLPPVPPSIGGHPLELAIVDRALAVARDGTPGSVSSDNNDSFSRKTPLPVDLLVLLRPHLEHAPLSLNLGGGASKRPCSPQ